MPNTPQSRPPAPRGRGFGYLVAGLLVGGITAVFSVQILIQVFAPPISTASPDCRAAFSELWQALERARQSAAKEPEEREAVRAFRAALSPQWQQWPSVRAWCGEQPAWRSATRALEQARQAEEQGVRFGARVLFRARQQAVVQAEPSVSGGAVSGAAARD